ncbi:MAG: lytic transglycosylase domain-containing protein [Actinomycetota bacterium]|nr:lytic transglycosylase domain-containing protein [Actinomycetota bacterium]
MARIATHGLSRISVASPSLICRMSGDERAGARTGRIWRVSYERFRRSLSRAPHYLLRGVLSGGALACAGLVITGLGSVAAPLPDRGLSAPAPAVMAAPAALPDVPEPAAQPVSAPGPGQPAGQPPQQTITIPVEIPQSAKPAGGPQLAFTDWASRLARVTTIPQRALQAYAHAHAMMAANQPNCRLTWVTLAGIAAVESQHGGFQGRTLEPDGRPSSPIIGVPLNGSPGVKAIGDTDGGLLDGDKVWDRAVGPFQFIPSTWAKWRADGNQDGITDPQNIDDAALAAAQYLCADNRNLNSGDGWLRAILSYNESIEYAQQVYGFAQGYARNAKNVT